MESENKITIKPENSASSGHLLIVIPVDSKYKPSKGQIAASLELLQREYPNCEINSEIYDSVEFVDPGQNFERVTCNLCRKEVSIDFWQERMSSAYKESHFANMDFQTECCSQNTNLNNLIYESDCGFASYYLSVNDAEYNPSNEFRLKEVLSQSLGAKVKLFWKHI